jgi:hypothetical protein
MFTTIPVMDLPEMPLQPWAIAISEEPGQQMDCNDILLSHPS